MLNHVERFLLCGALFKNERVVDNFILKIVLFLKQDRHTNEKIQFWIGIEWLLESVERFLNLQITVSCSLNSQRYLIVIFGFLDVVHSCSYFFFFFFCYVFDFGRASWVGRRKENQLVEKEVGGSGVEVW